MLYPPAQRSSRIRASLIHEFQHVFASTSETYNQKSVVVSRPQTSVFAIYCVCREPQAVVERFCTKGIWSPQPKEDPSPLRQMGSVIDIWAALAGFGNLELLMLVDVQHDPDHTGICAWWSGSGEATECKKLLRPWVHPAYCVGQYSWLQFEIGVFINESDLWQNEG
ncbi:hypothetical protein B0O99DRAFT_722933 [Bisporella sp. PMI_857]|nr:hypothetical protein B0O99DRAFT_722933 [Bisporella sp. PMI_857]